MMSAAGSTKMHDVVIVGGNFAGLSAALQLGRVRRRVLVVDAGEPRNRFAVASHGFLGQDGEAPFAIQSLAARQATAYPGVSHAKDRVTAIETKADGFEVRLASGDTARARKLLLATGVRDELPDVAGLAERWGKTVAHCPYCHGYELRDRRLGVLATMPHAAHVALLLPDLGPTTFFTQGLHEPDAEQAARFRARGIAVERSPVVELLGRSPALEAVRLADGRTVATEALFVASRVAPATGLFDAVGCAFDEGLAGPIVRVDATQQTSVPGVYAAG